MAYIHSADVLELAARLGIKDAKNMSPRDLGVAINQAPATPTQLSFAGAVANELNYPLPPSLTFGVARRLLDSLVPLVNERIAMTAGWDTGTVLHCSGKFLLICDVRSDKMFVVQPLRPVPSPRGGPSKFAPTHENKTTKHPLTLKEDGATIVENALVVRR